MSSATQAISEFKAADGHLITPRERMYLLAIAVVYLAIAIHSAVLKPFWFDELSTLFVSQVPTLGDVFRAAPVDGNPPLYFFLAHLCLKLPLKVELALRLPAIFAYLAASFTLYLFVRRNAGAVFSFLAMSMFLGSSMIFYAIEARSYSLLAALTGFTLCCWQSYCRAETETASRVALCGMGIGIAGAIFTHQYGLLYGLLPLGAGEITRSVRRRRVDLQLVGVCLLAALSLLATYPVMLSAQRELLEAVRNCPVFFARPHLSNLKDYAKMVPPLFLPFAALAVLALIVKLDFKGRQPEEQTQKPAIEDMAVGCVLTAFLPLMLVVTRLGTGFFQPRYGMGSAMGLAILAGLLPRWMGVRLGPERHATAVAWAGALYSFAVAMGLLWLVPYQAQTFPWSDPVLHAGPPSEAIVVASPIEFSPVWWYSDPAMRARLHYLKDLGYAGKHSNPIVDYSLAIEHEYTPMQLDSYEGFLSNHPRFLLYCFGEPKLEWIKPRLISEGWRLTLLRSAKLQQVKEDGPQQSELFDVSR